MGVALCRLWLYRRRIVGARPYKCGMIGIGRRAVHRCVVDRSAVHRSVIHWRSDGIVRRSLRGGVTGVAGVTVKGGVASNGGRRGGVGIGRIGIVSRPRVIITGRIDRTDLV